MGVHKRDSRMKIEREIGRWLQEDLGCFQDIVANELCLMLDESHLASKPRPKSVVWPCSALGRNWRFLYRHLVARHLGWVERRHFPDLLNTLLKEKWWPDQEEVKPVERVELMEGTTVVTQCTEITAGSLHVTAETIVEVGGSSRRRVQQRLDAREEGWRSPGAPAAWPGATRASPAQETPRRGRDRGGVLLLELDGEELAEALRGDNEGVGSERQPLNQRLQQVSPSQPILNLCPQSNATMS